MRMSNSRSGKTDAMSIVIFLLIGYVAFFYQGGLFKASAAPAGDGGSAAAVPAGNVVQVVGAPCTQATTLAASILRRHTDVAQTSENVTIYQNGVERTTIAHGSTAQVQSGSNGDMLDLYPALQSTTFYAQHVAGKLATCTGSATTGDPQFKFVAPTTVGGTPISYSDSVNKVVQIADALTVQAVNDGQASQNNGPIPATNSGGANLTLGQGGSASVSLTFRPDYQEGVGAIGGNILACQFASSVYAADKPLSVFIEGNELPESDVKPSVQRYSLIAANYTVKAFKFPGLDGKVKGVVEGSMIIRASSNNEPGGVGDRINCTIFDTNAYKKQTGEIVWDTENRDSNANLGGTETNYDWEIGVA